MQNEAIQKLYVHNTILYFGFLVHFWVTFGYIWEKIVFLEGLIKFEEIKKFEDLM